ncbi:MAG: formyltransferase family protein, partial [Rikenellaceae bacterium]
GKGMYGDRVHEAVYEAKEKQSGITIHYVNENFDDGDIIFQATVLISDTDTANDIANKVHALEYKYFPEIIANTIL